MCLISKTFPIDRSIILHETLQEALNCDNQTMYNVHTLKIKHLIITDGIYNHICTEEFLVYY